jgi:hypothetical protein
MKWKCAVTNMRACMKLMQYTSLYPDSGKCLFQLTLKISMFF